MSASETPQDDDLSMLTDEERAAIQDGEADDQERATLSRLAQQDDDDLDLDPDNPDADLATKPDAAAKPEPEPDPEPTPAPKPRAAFVAEMPENYEETKAAFAADAEALNAQFENGEIESSELTQGLREIAAKESALDRAAIKAEIAGDMAKQAEADQAAAHEAAWTAAVARVVDDAAKPEHGGIDYRKDADKAADLDAAVRSLGSDARYADKSMDWFLAEAHRRVLMLHGIAAAAPAAGAKDKPTGRAAPAVPVSLAHVPGADGPGDVDDEFSEVDALEGDALEDALAAMQRAQPARYEKFMRVGR